MIDVILLCAGYATRLYPLTENQPKPLLPVGDHPILEWILKRLEDVRDIGSVWIVSNHRFASHFGEWLKNARYPWPIGVVDDRTTTNENRLGAIGDLRFVLKEKKISGKDLLVIAGDNLFDFDLREFVRFAGAKRPHGAIAIYDVKDRELAKQYGLVRVEADGRIAEFYEKPQDPPTTLASCGLYWLPAESLLLLDRYIADGHNADQPGHYMRWLAQTDGLFAIPLEGRWYDIGDHASYEKANAIFRDAGKKLERK